MKRKKLNDVYMREVLNKNIYTNYNKELNAYITIKEIISTSQNSTNYVNGRKVVVVDNGYTIIEYTPLNKKYNVRVFINDNKEIIKYYFDIIDKFEIINNEIYYDDLYLDIMYDMEISTGTSKYITLVDESELLEALNNNDITKEMYDEAFRVAEELMLELKRGTNIFVNRGILDLNSSEVNYENK